MANEEHLEILRQGVGVWNDWRRANTGIRPDLYGASLPNADLAGAYLSSAILYRADLAGANLSWAKLDGAELLAAVLSRAKLEGASLRSAELMQAMVDEADLRMAVLYAADVRGATFAKSDLTGADLRTARFDRTDLAGANLSGSAFSGTALLNTDLRQAKGLDKVWHQGPSEVGINTILESEGRIPDVFLRGCGVPESFIVNLRSLVAGVQPIQFYSCFISYSTEDEEFAKRLHARMRQEGLRVWFAPEDMKGGDYFSDQIDRAIQMHDRLLLVLSENSIRSKWVIREITRARKVEEREGRKKLFPISLTSYEVLRGWEHLEHDSGLDLAEEVRKFHIPNFSNWKNHDDFEREFKRLYESLKAEA